jgi:hypothetical protein
MADHKKYCVQCSVSLSAQKTGRPQICCDKCKRKLERTRQHNEYLKRKPRQHDQYLKRKYPGLSETEIQLKELETAISRGHRKELRFLNWEKHHFKKCFASLTEKNEAIRKLREYEQKGFFCGEPLLPFSKLQILVFKEPKIRDTTVYFRKDFKLVSS